MVKPFLVRLREHDMTEIGNYRVQQFAVNDWRVYRSDKLDWPISIHKSKASAIAAAAMQERRVNSLSRRIGAMRVLLMRADGGTDAA